jgi:nitrogen fixation protein FixH
MNWGHKITIVIISFIVIMLSMVFVAFKQTNEMIENNYYDREIKYQSMIDAAANLNSLSSDSVIIQNTNNLEVQIPKNLVKEFTKGKIEFVKNDDEKKDQLITFAPDVNGSFSINKAKFSSGAYTAKIEWTSGSKLYYREQKIIIKL